ncbi:MAG: YebC/PmpR family DNA-binding transcriptional regulator [Acidobacteria bacterium]|nr:MAG: YebC/PmpR family DNA-binding transcriptional regulator [Acidobacteriota bacterium]
MSGHSKWATIKHKKGAADAKRGKLFTKLIKEIAVAARIGGGDPDANPRLRAAIGDAKAVNMPADNIKRAIQRGTGELPGVQYEEIVYEGYGPSGVALILEVATDNRNRTLADLRHILSKHGGNLGETGCVTWIFSKRGYIVVEKSKAEEDALLELITEAGADDMTEDGENWEILCPVEKLPQVVDALNKAGIKPVVAELSMVPQTQVKVSGKPADQVLRLMDELDEHEDVQHVYANFDIEDAELQSLAQQSG